MTRIFFLITSGKIKKKSITDKSNFDKAQNVPIIFLFIPHNLFLNNFYLYFNCIYCVFVYRTKVDHFTFVLTDLESKYKFGYCRQAQGVQTCLCIVR